MLGRDEGEVEEGGANSMDEPGDVVLGGMRGSDMEVREWCGRDIFQHTYPSSLPLIGVPPRWE